jgi:hypothetical protein
LARTNDYTLAIAVSAAGMFVAAAATALLPPSGLGAVPVHGQAGTSALQPNSGVS